MQLCVNIVQKATEHIQCAWEPATHVGDLDRHPLSWLRPGATSGIEVIWEVNQWIEYLSTSM